MANILDLLKVSSTKALFDSFQKKLSLDELQTTQILAMMLPWVVSKLKNVPVDVDKEWNLSKIKLQDISKRFQDPFISTEEKRDFINFAKNSFGLELANLLEVVNSVENIVYSIVGNISLKNSNLKIEDIKKCLLGSSEIASAELVEVITQHAETSGNLIPSADEIALQKKSSSNDSILGGYTGGK